MTIVLVGLPGSGKSSVGRQLGRRLNLPFADSDTCIEQRIGCSIRDFFERKGEANFRDVEQTVLAELMPGHGGVIATGGGSVLRQANRQLLQQHSHVIYLRSSPEDLFRRLRHDLKRPLLQVADPLGRLRDLHRERDPLYREVAHQVVDTGRPSVSVLVSLIVAQLALAEVVLPIEPSAGIDEHLDDKL